MMEAHGAIRINQNGDIYHSGKIYDDTNKLDVALKYLELLEKGSVTCRRLAELLGVGKTYASQIISEV